jgi:alginate O-acetyltransferase complex protein AlgJ
MMSISTDSVPGMRFKRIAVCIFVGLLWLPTLQRVAKLATLEPLHGVTNRMQKPRWTFTDWFSGAYQSGQDRYFSAKFGLRPAFVRTFNQLHFSLFGRVPGRRGTQVVVGREHWLYERPYVNHLLSPARVSDADLQRLARRLRALQDALQQQGKAFVFVLSPSKAEIYPQFLPAEELSAGVPGIGAGDHERLMPMLKAAGVQVVDTPGLFASRVETAPYPLFARGGTHWNYYSIYLVLDELLAAVNAQLPGEMPGPDYRDVVMEPPRGTDTDLADLLNLWRNPTLKVPAPYARVVAPDRALDERPDVLVVGDSFALTLIDALRAGRVSGKLDFLYYFKRHFDVPSGDAPISYGSVPNARLDHRSMDWDRLLRDKQIIVLEINQIMLAKHGWGFVEAALEALGQPTPP